MSIKSSINFCHTTQEKLSHINCNTKHFQAFPYPLMWYHVIRLVVVYPGHGLVGISPFTIFRDCLVNQQLILGAPTSPPTPLLLLSVCTLPQQ